MNSFLNKKFKWNTNEIIKCTLGVLLFSSSINLFIEPAHLYGGGVIGLSQLISRLIAYLFNTTFNTTGILYFLINIPLFILAYFQISKSFCLRTMYTIIIQTIALSLIPIPEKMLVDEVLTNVIVGGALGGIGCALVLSATGSLGGTDIIGIVLTSKKANFSVGKFAIIFNSIIFGISGILYGISTMIYSIIFSAIENFTLDKLHEQNISSSALIFSKSKPTRILNFIKNDLDRGATWWKGTGEYKQTDTYIVYVVLSRYELHQLEKFLKDNKEEVFLTKSDFVGVDGEFTKRLSK